MPDYRLVVENCDNRDPISHREPAIVPQALHRIAAVSRAEDLPRSSTCSSLLVVVAHAAQQIVF